MLCQGLPLALGLASHALINLVDLAMVGRLGEDAVRAAHVGSTWNFLPMIVGQCVSTALLGLLSRRLGQGDVAGARAANGRAQWFMVWLGLAVAIATTLPAVWMVDATGLVGAVRDDALHYLVVSNLGCLPMFVLMQTTAAMRAAGEAAMPLALLLFANVLNLALCVVLLYGIPSLGVPALGVVGAAYAAVAARTLGAVFAWWWLARRAHALSFRGSNEAPGAVVWPLVHDAWPQAVQIGLRAAVFLGLTVLVQHRFGDAATAALGITTRFDTVVLFASLGFANAATAFAGRAVSRGNARALRAAGLWAGVQAGALGAVFVLAMIAFAEPLVYLFVPLPTPELVAMTATYFHTAAFAQVLGAVALGAMGAVQGAGRMLPPMVVDLCGFAVVAVLFAVAATTAGVESVYLSLVVGMGVLAVLHLAFVAKGAWVPGS